MRMWGLRTITYHFTHILIHNYVQSKISAGRKQIYHRQVAGYYEQKYKETGDITLMPELIYHSRKCQMICTKNMSTSWSISKEFFSGTQEIYPAMSL